jgi:hypothetical protein
MTNFETEVVENNKYITKKLDLLVKSRIYEISSKKNLYTYIFVLI